MARSGSLGQLSAASGVTVRATAVAAVGRVSFATSGGTYTAGLAKTIGPVDPAGTYAGHVAFAVNADVWAGLTANGGTLTATGRHFDDYRRNGRRAAGRARARGCGQRVRAYGYRRRGHRPGGHIQ